MIFLNLMRDGVPKIEKVSVHKNKPSRTAYKVALNIVTLGAKPGLNRFLPPGIVQATEKLLVTSGAARASSKAEQRTCKDKRKQNH